MMTIDEFHATFPGAETFIGFAVCFVVFAISFWIGHKLGGGGA